MLILKIIKICLNFDAKRMKCQNFPVYVKTTEKYFYTVAFIVRLRYMKDHYYIDMT